MMPLFTIECRPPWLIARFPSSVRTAGWSVNRPGFADTDTVSWLQVVDTDLSVNVDPVALLETRLEQEALSGSVAMMTARDIRCHHSTEVQIDDVRVNSLVTAGLTNAVAIDKHGRTGAVPAAHHAGTINLLVAMSCALSDGAMLEAISIATLARTKALIDAGAACVGTGTDCIVLACIRVGDKRPYAGLHTPIGEAIAASVFGATHAAVLEWLRGVGTAGAAVPGAIT